ncbi:30S ribosomal protein S19 [archaeon]|nr:30S ribosomal protein S19 [archaeon]|tara:strand:- start:1781 stop:2176 length:396 start_codon:yes stop_codon:yes gene_type:complete
MAKEFTYKGHNLEQLKKMEVEELMKIMPSSKRRSLKRGYSEEQNKLLKKIDRVIEGSYKKPIKTHCRDIIIIPKMVNLTIHVHKGNAFIPVHIAPESIGMYLGELVLTRQRVQHSAPGVGATKSSASVSVK